MTRDEYLSAIQGALGAQIERLVERWADRAQVLFEAHVGEDEERASEALEAATKLLEGEITLLEEAFPDPKGASTNRAVLLALFWLFLAQVREMVGTAVASAAAPREEPGDRARETGLRYRAA